MNERYAEIVLQEDIDPTYIRRDDATRFDGLRSIHLPAYSGNGDRTQTVKLVRLDGTVERVQGHVLSTGIVDDTEGDR